MPSTRVSNRVRRRSYRSAASTASQLSRTEVAEVSIASRFFGTGSTPVGSETGSVHAENTAAAPLPTRVRT